MHKICRIALSVSLSLSLSVNAFAFEKSKISEELPVLTPESQHATASKRITARFTRAHYKKVTIDDSLSSDIFDRFIKQLDYARNVFMLSDIEKFNELSRVYNVKSLPTIIYTTDKSGERVVLKSKVGSLNKNDLIKMTGEVYEK